MTAREGRYIPRMGTLRKLSRLVMLQHAVFALPYAFAGMVLGADAAEVRAEWLVP